LIKENYKEFELLFNDKRFVELLLQLIIEKKGLEFLSVSWEKLKSSPHIVIISKNLLYETVLSAFSKNRMEVEGMLSNSMKIETAIKIIDFIEQDKNILN
jgi:hypothetical protein